MADKDITARQREYIRHRIAGLSQRKAYLKAYPHAQKWKPESVDKEASILEHNPKVSPRLKEGRKRRLEEAIEDGIVEGKDVLRELARVGFANATDFVKVVETVGVNLAGQLCTYKEVDVKLTDDVPADKLAAISSIKQTKDGGIEIKLHPKVQALTKLGEAIGLFDSKTTADTTDIAAAIEAAWGETHGS